MFEPLYAEWRESVKDSFPRNKNEKIDAIQNARIKLILCLICFDHFIAELSSAYEASHETSYGQNELFGFLQSRFQQQQNLLPSALCGNLFGMKKNESDDDMILFRQFAFGRSLMTDLPYLKVDKSGNPIGAHTILLSGSSWAEGSYTYHINRPIQYILEADTEKRHFLEKTSFFELYFTERVSGLSGEQKEENLRGITRKCTETIIEEYNRNAGKILLVVNSYVQAVEVQQVLTGELKRKHCAAKVFRMVSDTVEAECEEGIIRRGEVYRFANMQGDILIAPAMAIERGHNIVDERGHSALSAVFFMVRPMSVPDDVQELGSKLNGYMESHCKRKENESVFAYHVRMRQEATKQWEIMNGSKAYGLSTLDEKQKRDVIATLFILILQIFGRLCRVTDTTKPAPHVYFVDGAFRRSEKNPDGVDCLNELRKYLDELMNDKNSAEIARTLYEPFYVAFKRGISCEL